MKRVFIFVFLSSLLLFGCGKTSNDKQQPTQGKPRPGITGALSPSATPTPSIDPLFSPTPTLTPIPEGKLLGWLLVEERSRVDGEDILEQKSYDEKNRLIKTETYHRYVSEDVLFAAEEYTYDKQGNCILRVSVDEYGNKEIEKKVYDGGRLTKRQLCNTDGTPWQTEIYTVLEDGTIRYENRREDDTLRYYSLIQHDAAGNVIEECSFLEDGTCCTTYRAEYGEFGILSSYEEDFDVSQEGEGPSYRITGYSYDSAGKLIRKKATTGFLNSDIWRCEEEEYRYEGGKLVYKSFRENFSWEDTVLLEEVMYRYDNEEQIYEASWYNGVLQSQEEWRCVFDDSGRLLEKIRLEADGTDSLHKKTYRYDDYGNCIEILDQQGMRKDIYTYTYEPILETEAAN